MIELQHRERALATVDATGSQEYAARRVHDLFESPAAGFPAVNGLSNTIIVFESHLVARGT
jgi:hypothetical protein